MSDFREAPITHDEGGLPGGVLLQAGPFLILALAGLWLRRHFDELPARVPVHWNVSGNADRFVARTPQGVAGPLWVGAAVCALFLVMQILIRYGAPRSGMRPLSLKILLAVEYFIAFLFCGILSAMVTGGRMLAPVLALSFAGALVLLVATLALARKPRAAPRPGSGGQWRGGFFYVDAEDPALFVPKRYGIGYTFNYGNPLALVITVLLLLAPVAIAFLALSAR